MALLMSHPEIALRDCEDCKKWWYKDDGSGEIHTRRGEKLPRPTPPPCDLNVGCPKGHWKNQKSLNERNLMAYQHYRECRAVGSFPNDSLVRQHASIIRDIEDAAERADGQRSITHALTLATLAKGGKR